MSIGTNIKKYRTEQHLTQEQLAELLNLTPSAISQWETDRVLPDVTQIPLLANIFHVSTDKIFGVDIENNQEKITKYAVEGNDLSCFGKPKEAIEVFRAGLREFPNSTELMTQLALALEEEDAERNTPEIISLCEKVLELSADEYEKNRVIGNLIRLYMKTGREQQARNLAESVPVLMYSRSQCLRFTMKGKERVDDLRQELRDTFDIWLWDLRNLIAQGRATMTDGHPYFSDGDALLLYKKIVSFIEVFYENGDYGFHGQLLCEMYYGSMTLCAKAGDRENLIRYFDLLVRQIKQSDRYEHGLRGNVTLPVEKRHTSILAQPLGDADLSWCVSSPAPEEYTHQKEYYDQLNSAKVFDAYREDEKFRELLGSLAE